LAYPVEGLLLYQAAYAWPPPTPSPVTAPTDTSAWCIARSPEGAGSQGCRGRPDPGRQPQSLV